MAVAVTGNPSIVPVINDRLPKIGTALPTFTRTGTATRVNSSGLVEVVTATSIPRIDYSPQTLALRGWLIEEARTNLCLFSQSAGAEGSPTVWLTTGATLTANAETSPAGDVTATRVTVTANDGELRQAFAGLTSANKYAFSIFLKGVTITDVRLRAPNSDATADFNLSTGVVSATAGAGFVAATIERYAVNEYWRCTIIYTQSGTTEIPTIRENGSGTSGEFRVWGAQLENCSTGEQASTSYIPTTSAAVARGVEAPTISDLDTWFNADEGSVFCEFVKVKEDKSNQNRRFWEFNDGTSNNRFGAFISGGDLAGFNMLRGGVTQSSTTLEAYTYGNTGRFAFAYAENDLAASFNGGAVSTDTAATLPTVSKLDIASSNGSTILNGHIRKLAYYDERLSNADLVTLSGGGSISTEAVWTIDCTQDQDTGSLDYARIGYHTITRDGTLSASSAHASYPSDAAQRPDTFESWQPTALPATWRIDAGSAVAIDYFAIAEHDLGTKECSVEAQYSADDSNWYNASNAFQPEVGDDSPIMLIFSAQLARYWRLKISGVGSPTEVPTLAVIHMGRTLVMQRSIYGGHAPVELSDETLMRTNRLTGGQFAGQSFEAHGVVTQASFRFLTPAWVRENFKPFKKDARRYPYFWAWRPGDYPEGSAYVQTAEDIRPTNQGVREFMQVSWAMEGIGLDEDD